MSNTRPCPELQDKVEELEKQIVAFKTHEHALEECEDQFQALLNATADSAFLIDPRGTILAMNEAGAQRLGKRAEDVIGENVWGLLPPHIAKRRSKEVKEVLRSGKPVRFQDEREGLIFDHTVYPVMDDKGNVVKLAVYARDVTRQKDV